MNPAGFGLYIVVSHPEWERVELMNLPLPVMILAAADEVVCVPRDGLGFNVLKSWRNRLPLGVHRDAQYTVPTMAPEEVGGAR